MVDALGWRAVAVAAESSEDAGRIERRRRRVAGRVEMVEREVLEVLGNTGAADRSGFATEEEGGRLFDSPSPSLLLDTCLLLLHHPKGHDRTHSSDDQRLPFHLHPISCDEK